MARPQGQAQEIPGGAEGSRTPDLLIANEALYQLSYGPLSEREERGKYGGGSPAVKRKSRAGAPRSRARLAGVAADG